MSRATRTAIMTLGALLLAIIMPLSTPGEPLIASNSLVPQHAWTAAAAHTSR
jgi:hypothetical protein